VALATSQTVTGLPTDGRLIYVTLWTLINAAWEFEQYTYRAAGGNFKSVLTSPTPGTALAGNAQQFTWSSVSGAQLYWLTVGGSVGSSDIFDGNQNLRVSRTVTGLPIDGRTLYVRVYTVLGTVNEYNDYTFKASGGN